MLPFLVFLLTLINSNETPSKKLTHIESSTDHVLSNVGFYDILVRGGESITANLSNGQNRLFIVVPSHPNVSIEEIKVDNLQISDFHEKKGFVFNGNEKVTIRINSTDPNSILQVNAWLIPNKYCSSSAIYAYGSRRIRYQNSISTSEFCIFSPTLDSKNNNFIVNYGINASNQNYGSSLYKSDFKSPQQTTTGDEMVNYESDGQFFIHFNLDAKADNETVIYERKTKTISFRDKDNKCTIEPFYRCSNNDNIINCDDDRVGEFDVKICSGLQISGLSLGLIITFGVLAILAFIAGIVLCSCCCNCCACCCCNRNHKSHKKAAKTD